MEAAAAFSAFFNFDLHKEAVKPPEELTWRERPALDVQFHRTHEEVDYDFRMRVILQGANAFAIVRWGAKIPEIPESELFEPFELTSPSPAPGSTPFDDSKLLPRLREAHGTFFLALAEEYERQERSAEEIGALTRACELEPGHEGLHISLIRSLNRTGATREALVRANMALELHPRFTDVQSWKAYLLKELGEQEAAATEYESLFQAGHRSLEDLGYFVDVAHGLGTPDRVTPAFALFKASGESLGLAREEARRAALTGDRAGAITSLQSALDRFPVDLGAVYDLLSYLYQEKRHREAVSVCDAHTPAHPTVARLQFEKGRHEYALGWYRQALESFRKTLEIEPLHERAKEFEAHVQGLLGKGDISTIRTPVEAVPWPAGLAKQLAETDSAPPDVEGSGAIYLHRIWSVHFEPGEDLRTTSRRKIRILDNRGLETFTTLTYDFDPLDDRIFVNELIVTDREGKETYRGKIEDYYVLDASDDEASQDQRLHIPVSGLQPGGTLEIAVTWESLSAPTHVPWRRYSLTSSYPIHHVAVSFSGDLEHLVAQASGAERSSDEAAAFWHLQNPRRYRDEPRGSRWTRFSPHLLLGDARRKWEELGRQYLDDIADKLEVGEAVKQRAREIVGDRESLEEKVLALIDFVQKDCVYKAIEFGERGRIPNTAEEVLGNRYGDCKDQAVLLRGLLSAVDIPSHLVLVQTAADLDRRFPSLNQFNHMILQVPGFGPAGFVDTTDLYLDPRYGAPLSLGDEPALILDGENIRFETIPTYRLENNVLQSDLEIEVGEAGSLKVRREIRLSGIYASYMRSFLKGYEPGERARQLQRSMGGGLLLDVELETVENLETPRDPLHVVLRGRVRDRVVELEGRTIVTWPAQIERSYLEETPFDGRQTPWEVPYPLRVVGTSKMTIPDGLHLATAVPEAIGVTASMLPHSFTTRLEDSTLQTSYRIDRGPLVDRPAESYTAYAAEIQKVLSSLESRWVLEKKESPPHDPGK